MHTPDMALDAAPSHPTTIACSLTADQSRRRAAATGELAREALSDRQPVTGGLRLTFRDEPGVRQRLRAFADAESECCPFLAITLHTGEGDLVLDLTGPPEAQPIIAALFA